MIESRVEFIAPIPEGVVGRPKLTVIEWKLSDVDPRLYFRDPGGAIVEEIQPRVGVSGIGCRSRIERGLHARPLGGAFL